MSTVYTVNGKVLKNAANDKWLAKKEGDPYNPFGLDSGVFRIKVTPGTSSWVGAQTSTLVPGTSDVYDVQFTESNISQWNKSIALEVLGANTTGWTIGLSTMFASCSNLTSVALFDTSSATNLSSMFNNCSSLTTVPLFNTSSVTNMQTMFSGCSSLTSIPLFDTSSATNMYAMFNSCTNVESGALALYQQASTQTTPPSEHSGCFYNCGTNTTTGAAELAQIPVDWK